jgi:hypothetical protein
MARTDKSVQPPQLSGSVDTSTPTPVHVSGGNQEPPVQRMAGILGTPVDTGPQPFPTIPAGFNANLHYYPGLSHSYLGAAYIESPMRAQIRYATYDIQSIQLTLRGPAAADVIAQWQLMLTSPASIMPGG